MKQPSTKILHSPTPSGYKRVKAFAILCVLMFMGLSVHATVVPNKYITVKYLATMRAPRLIIGKCITLLQVMQISLKYLSFQPDLFMKTIKSRMQ